MTPVYATLVSSGRIRDPEDPLQTHDTPTGLWRIRSKYVTHTMDGDHATDGPYSIEDVPYVMYFELAFALEYLDRGAPELVDRRASGPMQRNRVKHQRLI